MLSGPLTWIFSFVTIQATAIDEKMCLSFAFPKCKLHLSRDRYDEDESKHGMIEENPEGVFQVSPSFRLVSKPRISPYVRFVRRG